MGGQRKVYDPSIPNNSWGPTNPDDELTQWLIDNPEFEDRPASMEEFLGPEYLDIDYDQNPSLGQDGVIRPGVKAALIDIFGQNIDPESISEKREALFTGGIGIGKTTMAAIALAYMVHWVLCLHDPQGFFGMMKGRRIAFMLMSTKDSQAKEVLFGDIKATINNSKWFREYAELNTEWRGNTAYDPDYKNQLRFPKNIWVLPGNSAETTFEGYNILGGILDEGDSHKVTENKDYAEVGWRTIKARVTSRFTNPATGEHRGLLIAIGQMKIAEGFMARTKKAMEEKNEKLAREGKPPLAKVVHMAIWESFGWEKYRNKKTGEIEVFWYDIDRKIIVPPAAAAAVKSDRIIKVPISYRDDFELNPVQALKDHAGIPPHVDDPFIGAADRVKEAQQSWLQRFGSFIPVVGRPDRPHFNDDLGYPANPPSAIKRALHVDIAYASHGDALGMAMAHIPEMVEINGEIKPVIVFDFLLRLKPSGGQNLMLSDFRKLIFELRDERKFKMGVVTFDGFQSLDSIQILREKRFNTAELSVDRNKGPYEELREAIYERRIEFPPLEVYLKKGDHEKVNIIEKELLELTDTGRKVDHPPKGCFVGETRIPTLDGKFPQISDLAGKEAWVYSATSDGKIVPGRARGRYTKHVDHLVDVILDNGYVSRCTPDHLWMLRDGTYKPAEDLRPGVDRLMPVTFNWPVNGGYARVGDKDGVRTLTHTLVLEHSIGRKLEKDELAHHKDEDKLNNDPSNLELMTFAEHRLRHANDAWARDRQAKMKAGHEKWLNSPEKDEAYARRSNPGWTKGKTPEEIQAAVEAKEKYRRDITVDSLRTVLHAETANEAARMLNCGRNVVMARLKKAGYPDWAEFVRESNNNHKVRAVVHVKLDEPVPVYDLEVDEWSNFALTGGVFVHNSKDVADAMAGCVWALMSNDQFRRGAKRASSVPFDDDAGPIDIFGARRKLDPEELGQGFDPSMFKVNVPHGLPAMERNPFAAFRR